MDNSHFVHALIGVSVQEAVAEKRSISVLPSFAYSTENLELTPFA
jgi:hypothetical protein